jgi:Ca2+-binding EF-hand superfamily protein
MSTDAADVTVSVEATDEAAAAAKVAAERPANITVEVSISKDPKGLGLVIGLSKKSKSNPDKPQVVFIRALQRRSDGTQSEAVKKGEMMAQDVVEAVNDTEVGKDLSVLTEAINKVPINGDIKFRLSRRAKDEGRRVKALQDKEKAQKLDLQLRVLFNAIDTGGNGDGTLTLEEIDAVGKDVFLDKLGLHLPDSVRKDGFKSLEAFAAVGDEKITFEQFRGVLYGKELALACQKTRYAKYAVIFKKLDADNSRTISKSEFINADGMLKKLFGEGSDALKAEFAAMDENADDNITFNEFANGCEAFYTTHMHPDGYEAVEGGDWTAPEAAADVDDDLAGHFDEEHAEESAVPEVISQVPSVMALEDDSKGEASKEGEEGEAAEPTEAEKLVAAAKVQHDEAEAAKEVAAMEKHKAEMAARKKKKADDLAKKKADAEAAEAAKAAEEAEAASAPASGGCCVIA